MESSPGEVTLLLGQLAEGDADAMSKLIPLVYGELRRLAAGYLRRERPDHTLQPTALVHEAYLKLVQQRRTNWQNRTHFFGVAAQLMRRILVDHARGRLRSKRGAGHEKISLDEELVFSEERSEELLALDEALGRLEKLDARQSQVVELRFFGGLTLEETAHFLNISPKTVEREWTVAKAWLHMELREGNGSTAGKVGDNQSIV